MTETNAIAARSERAGDSSAEAILYRVVALDKMDAPPGAKGSSWYRYVIDGGYSTVTGCRGGTRKEIQLYAEQLAADLNARRRGAGAPSWAPRKPKPA